MRLSIALLLVLVGCAKRTCEHLAQRNTILFDGEGRRISQEVSGATGEISLRIAYTYGDGRETIDTDWNADGSLESRAVNIDDPEGRLLAQEHDDPFDGTIDRRTTYYYGESGSVERSEEDAPADGVIDSVTHYVFSGADWQFETTDANGAVLSTFSRSSEGDQVVIVQTDNRRMPPSRSRRVEVRQGNTRTTEYDFDDDGAIESRWIETFNDDGTIMQRDESTYIGEPVSTERTSYTYEAGQIVREETDYGIDGDIEERTLYRREPGQLVVDRISLQSECR